MFEPLKFYCMYMETIFLFLLQFSIKAVERKSPDFIFYAPKIRINKLVSGVCVLRAGTCNIKGEYLMIILDVLLSEEKKTIKIANKQNKEKTKLTYPPPPTTTSLLASQ